MSLDPFGSLICPLAFAIAGGACAILKPNDKAKNVQALVQRLVPQYLDREAHVVVSSPILELLNLGCKTVVYTDRLPHDATRPISTQFIRCEAGLNVLCHLDARSAIDAFATVLARSEVLRDVQARVNVAVVLKSKLDEFCATFTQQTGNKPRLSSLDNVWNTRETSDLIVVPATSTEEALFVLQKRQAAFPTVEKEIVPVITTRLLCSDISRFAYFGDAQYGAYMLKFLPDVDSGDVNSYDPSMQYPSLTAESFQRRRRFSSLDRPRVPSATGTSINFPKLIIDCSKPYNFFLLGLAVSRGIMKTMAVGAVATILYYSWRRLY